jgi:hypothetical protein
MLYTLRVRHTLQWDKLGNDIFLLGTRSVGVCGQLRLSLRLNTFRSQFSVRNASNVISKASGSI